MNIIAGFLEYLTWLTAALTNIFEYAIMTLGL